MMRARSAVERSFVLPFDLDFTNLYDGMVHSAGVFPPCLEWSMVRLVYT